MSYEMVGVTYFLSVLLVLVSVMARRHIAAHSSSARVNSISTGMLIFGLMWLTCLIASPFSTLVKR